MEVINLQKGQTIDLRKNKQGVDVYDLSTVTIGLGWDVREVYKTIKVEEQQSMVDKLLSRPVKYKEIQVPDENQDDYDLDAIAFCLDSNGKVANLGKEATMSNGNRIPFQQSDIIYFHNLIAPSGNFGVYQNLSKPEIARKVQQLIANGEYIIHTGDNLTGEGDGDDEQIVVRLNSLPERIQKIVFLVCIYKGQELNQHFGMVDNAFIRAVDGKGLEIARFDLSSDANSNGKHSVTFAEVYRKDGGWKFRAIGDTHETDLFINILKQYLYNA
jgi:tellurium resistance protein TerD